MSARLRRSHLQMNIPYAVSRNVLSIFITLMLCAVSECYSSYRIIFCNDIYDHSHRHSRCFYPVFHLLSSILSSIPFLCFPPSFPFSTVRFLHSPISPHLFPSLPCPFLLRHYFPAVIKVLIRRSPHRDNELYSDRRKRAEELGSKRTAESVLTALFRYVRL